MHGLPTKRGLDPAAYPTKAGCKSVPKGLIVFRASFIESFDSYPNAIPSSLVDDIPVWARFSTKDTGDP